MIIKHLLLSPFLFFSVQTFSQSSQIAGKIKNLSSPQDLSFNVVFIKDGVRMDSTVTTASGTFNKHIAPGLYDLEVSKSGIQSAMLNQVYLNPGQQAVNISVKITMPAEPLLLPPGDSVKHVSYFYILPRKEPRILTPAFMRRTMDDEYTRPIQAPSAHINTAKANETVVNMTSGDSSGARNKAAAASESRSTMTAEVMVTENWYMSFYPNPAADMLNITFSEQVESIKITDLFGKLLYERKNEGQSSMQIDLSTWASGAYVVIASNKNETVQGKVMVKH